MMRIVMMMMMMMMMMDEDEDDDNDKCNDNKLSKITEDEMRKIRIIIFIWLASPP